MSVLLDMPHTATVRALSQATVYAYPDAAGFMRSDPQITFVIARLLAQRLNSATTYLVDLKRQYAGQGNHLGMVSDVLASLIHQPGNEFTPGSDRQPDPAT
jgi:CRP-like cAMP-binding protein